MHIMRHAFISAVCYGSWYGCNPGRTRIAGTFTSSTIRLVGSDQGSTCYPGIPVAMRK